MTPMSARIDTPTLDARSSAASDAGKGRAGQNGSDAFGGVLADVSAADAKGNAEPNAAATVVNPNVVALAMAGASFPASGASVTSKIADAAAPDAAQSLSGKLFQALVDGTVGLKNQTKTAASADDANPEPASRDPDADPASVAAMLAIPSMAAAMPAIATKDAGQLATDAKGSSTTMHMPTVATSNSRSGNDPLASAATGEMSAISDVKVETHIAVAAPASLASDSAPAAHQAETKSEPALSADALQAMAAPTRSVAQAVDALLPQTAAPTVAADPATVSPAPARTMTLQLNPANLGTVEVRLHLTGQALDIQLSVSSKETLGVISRDRTHLETALAAQSYDLRSLVIQSSDGAGASTSGDSQPRGQSTASQGGQGNAGQGNNQNQDTFGSGNGASGNGAAGSGGERRTAQTRGNLPDEAARAPGATRAGALFV